jgi:glucose/arabinose dehydrogenase
VFVADNCYTGNPHFGSKLAFGRDGMLYMTIGERGDRNRAQNTASHGGKILRLREDGTVPPDNPFVGRQGFKPEIYTYGHRNPQGLAVHPETGELWSNEHGPQGGDELNRIQAGKNYGWPVVTLGREYTGEIITNQPWREDIEQPVTFWSPSIGISGMTFYTGDRFPQWKNNIFIGGLSGNHVQRVVFNDRGLHGRETMLGALRLRVRDVRQGPDGLLYVAVDGNPAGLLRVEPAQAPTTAAAR